MNPLASQMDKPRPREPMVTSCPDCGQLVQLPACISLEAIVQCPRCQDQYSVRSLLPEDIPQLTVVTQQGNTTQVSQGVEVASGKVAITPSLLEVPESLRNAAWKGRKRRKSKEASDSTNVTNSEQRAEAYQSVRIVSGKSEKSAGVFRSNRSSRRGQRYDWAERSRRDQKPRNSTVEMIKVILGGLLALPVAQLIIWWVMGMDPLGLAPKVSASLPFVVPAKLREREKDDPVGFSGFDAGTPKP